MAAAIILVNLSTVVIIGFLSAAQGNRDINTLVQERRAGIIQSFRASAVGAYNTGVPGWSDVDLRPALEVTASTGTSVAVLDNEGQVVASSISDHASWNDASRSPITLNGERIGTLVVRFTSKGLGESADQLRGSLINAGLIATGIAILVSFFVAVFVARRSTRPIARLTEAARGMGAGDRDIRVGDLATASKELSTLAAAFDGMADAVDAQERLRRDLVSEVAHELRTPVAILQANCEALLDGVVPHTPDQTASLHEEVVRLAALVEDLQSLARADAAAVQMSCAPCDLAALVDLAADSMAARITSAGLTLSRHLQPAVIEGDAVRLHQVIMNVLGNAHKFTPAGGCIDIGLTTGPDEATLQISDTGVGISAEDQPYIFDRFWRGANAADMPGSGIGLAVVTTLVAAHGGNIRVDSQLGSGTSVSLTFPLMVPSTS